MFAIAFSEDIQYQWIDSFDKKKETYVISCVNSFNTTFFGGSSFLSINSAVKNTMKTLLYHRNDSLRVSPLPRFQPGP
jgi:hypothetical protein